MVAPVIPRNAVRIAMTRVISSSTPIASCQGTPAVQDSLPYGEHGVLIPSHQEVCERIAQVVGLKEGVHLS